MNDFIIGSDSESNVCSYGNDKDILDILKDLPCLPGPASKIQSQISVPSVDSKQYGFSGSFVSDTVFNLSRKFLLVLK